MNITQEKWRLDENHLFADHKESAGMSTNSIYVKIDNCEWMPSHKECVRYLPYTPDDLILMTYSKRMYHLLQELNHPDLSHDEYLALNNDLEQLLEEIDELLE